MRQDIPFNSNVKDGRAAAGLKIPKSNWANTIDIPPFLGFAVTCGITFTFGGLRITNDAQVVDTDGAPIPGRYGSCYHELHQPDPPARELPPVRRFLIRTVLPLSFCVLPPAAAVLIAAALPQGARDFYVGHFTPLDGLIIGLGPATLRSWPTLSSSSALAWAMSIGSTGSRTDCSDPSYSRAVHARSMLRGPQRLC